MMINSENDRKPFSSIKLYSTQTCKRRNTESHHVIFACETLYKCPQNNNDNFDTCDPAPGQLNPNTAAKKALTKPN